MTSRSLRRHGALAWLPGALSLGLLLGSPRSASACAVCFSGTEETRAAFLLTTAFLTVLPLLLIGSLAWWLRRRALAVERSADLRSPAPAAARAPSAG